MSRTLKRLEIGNYEWNIPSESGITILYDLNEDGNPPSGDPDIGSEMSYLVGMGYDSNGLPVIYNQQIDDPGYAADKYVYDGTMIFNGVKYDKWKVFSTTGLPASWPWSDDVEASFSSYYRLTNIVIKDRQQVQVESAICDGDGNIISNTYIKKANYPGSFVTDGNYSSLSGTSTAYYHEVTIDTTSFTDDNEPIRIKTFIINDNDSSGSITWSSIKNKIKGNAVIWYYTDYNSPTYNGTLCKSPGIDEWFLSGQIYINTPTYVSIGIAQEIK